MGRGSARCDWLAVWIFWSAWCSLAGWTLSALGALDRAGYVVTTLLFVVLLIAGRRWLFTSAARPPWLGRRSTYARHALPKIWLAGAVLVMAGALLFRPTDYDYLSYRFPRLLHWWWAHRWIWIDCTDERQNTSAVGMEWMMAPSFILFRTDRLFALINVVSFLFLPGLLFSVFRRLGVRGRMAWNWMWLLPFGYCYVLQAGSMANDAFAVVPFLASLYYAGRARPGAPLAAALSIISFALVTGDKASNIPLVLPWLAVVWLNRRDFFASARPAVLGVAGAVGFCCSFAPLGFLNILHTGSYTGDPQGTFQLELHSPVAGVIGNSLEILSGALSPPFWPHPLAFHFLPDRYLAELKQAFPRFAVGSAPFQLEDNAGIGLGMAILIVLSILAGIVARLRGRATTRPRGAWLFALGSVCALLGYMSKMGSEGAGRLVAVYYVPALLSLLLLLPDDGAWPRTKAWRALAALVMLVVLPLLVLNPARPLVPPALTTWAMRAAHVPPAAAAQLDANRRLRFARLDLYRPLLLALPATTREIDVIETLDDPETAWWVPFGSRQVVRAHPERPGSLAGHDVAVNMNQLTGREHLTLARLLQENSLRIAAQQDVAVRTGIPATWYLLVPAAPAPAAP